MADKGRKQGLYCWRPARNRPYCALAHAGFHADFDEGVCVPGCSIMGRHVWRLE